MGTITCCGRKVLDKPCKCKPKQPKSEKDWERGYWKGIEAAIHIITSGFETFGEGGNGCYQGYHRLVAMNKKRDTIVSVG